MEEDDSQQSFPKLHLQRPTVDFIDNRLPSHHQLFHNPPLHYDPIVQRYVPNANQQSVPRSYVVHQQHPGTASQDASPRRARDAIANADANIMPSSARPAWRDVNAMHQWKRLFPDALARFMATTAEPKGQADTEHSIRNLQDWTAIHAKLRECQSRYEKGNFVKARRNLADKMSPAAECSRNISAAVPDSLYLTPVVGIIQIVLDATSASATIRGEATHGFDDLIRTFSEIELYLQMYPDDEGIRTASIDLIVVTLRAIERSIEFFISNSASRAFQAIGMGNQYRARLTQSLDEIKNKSRRLLEEAQKSGSYASHTFSRDTRQIGQQLGQGQAELAAGQEHLAARQDSLAAGQQYLAAGQAQILMWHAKTFNTMESFLADHVQQRKYWLAQEEKYKQNIASLEMENNILRSASPGLPSTMLSAPPSPRFNQDQLWDLLGAVEVDLTDMAAVLEKTTRLPSRQRAQAEQITQTHLFRDWLTSPFSTKLLVHWERHPPQKCDSVSPLSTFLASLTGMLRQNSTHFVAAVWFCAEHLGPSGIGSPADGRAMLASLIDQILRQYPVDLSTLPWETVRYDEGFNALFEVLEWLVRQLPDTITLIFLVDSVVSYEENQETIGILAFLLRLVGDQNLHAAVKVLFASTPGTNHVRKAFEQEDLIVHVEVLPRMVWAPSDERMGRELNRMVTD